MKMVDLRLVERGLSRSMAVAGSIAAVCRLILLGLPNLVAPASCDGLSLGANYSSAVHGFAAVEWSPAAGSG